MKWISSPLNRESSRILCLIFTVEAIIYLSLLIYTNQYILTKDVLLPSLYYVEADIQADFAKDLARAKMLSYLLMPLLFGCKLACIAVAIYAVLQVYNFELTVKDVFSMLLTAELVFIVVALFKIVAWNILMPVRSIEDLEAYKIPSLLNVFPIDKASPFYFLFQAINLAEMNYLLVIGLLLSKRLQIGLRKAMLYSTLSYGSIFFIWILLVSFIQYLYRPL